MPAKQNESGIFWFTFSPPQSIVFRQDFLGKALGNGNSPKNFIQLRFLDAIF